MMIMNSKISEYCTENKVVCLELILTTKSKDIAKIHKLTPCRDLKMRILVGEGGGVDCTSY